MECARHIERAQVVSSHLSLKSHFIKPNDLRIIKAEALFTSFLLEHNCPLSAADHAGPFFKQMFPDSEIAEKYGCARTKTTAIIKSFADSMVEQIVQKLKSAKFTLSTDGSNSTDNEKFFPILVTYLDISLERIVTMMLSLPKLCGDGTGENIFNLLNVEFEKYGIRWENCISFCSDNASVMTGKFKGVIKFIKDKNPKVVLTGCACHLLHLTAQHSSKVMDFRFEEFLVDIFYYLKKSSKRIHSLKLCQELCEVEVHKILKHGSTRWLSMLRVIYRILEQWEPLKMFFCEKEEQESEALLRIRKCFENPVIPLYLLFLQTVLPLFTNTNTFFQTESPLVHKLQRQLISVYTDCLSCFMKPSAIQNCADIFSIKFAERKLQKSTDDLVIGYKTTQYFTTTDLKDSEKKVFFKCVRSYYEKACSYMLKKLPLKDEFLKHAEVADISIRTQTKFNSLVYFIDFFSDIFSEDELNVAETEFAMYQVDNLNAEILTCNRDDTAWCKIGCLEDHNGGLKYKVLPKIMLNILLFPHSNTACERVFSTIRKTQNEFRSNLSRQTVELLLIQKCKFSSYGHCCYKENFSEKDLLKAKKATYLSLNTP